MKTINLHCHFPLSESELGLQNHSVLLNLEAQPNQLYSVGLHPWDLDNASEDWLQQLEEQLSHPNVRAVGECGIDRSLETSVEKQLSYLLPQLELAERFNMPVIFHAVRSYADLLQLKKSRPQSTSWILHGYQGNKETTEQLSKLGFFFSFGTSLLQNREKLNQALIAVPPNRLFFETDVSDVDIESIYIFAAALLDQPLINLKQSIFDNFQEILIP